MFTKSKLITLLLFSLFFITSCDNKNENSSGESTKITKKEYKYEDLNDPEYYKHERLQFIWRPKDEKLDSVWTIKLDGTDLRRVIDPKIMLHDGARDLDHQVPRSPNRRYLAYTNRGGDIFDRNIIDLKTGEIIKLGSDSVTSKLFWSPDGKKLFYDSRSNDYVYDMDKKTSTALKGEILVTYPSALSDGRTIAGHRKTGVSYYNYNGEFIKRIVFNDKENYSGGKKQITPSGSNLLHTYKNEYRLYALSNNLKIIKTHSIPKFIQAGIFVMHRNVNRVFMAANWGVMRYDLTTDDYTKIYDGDGSRIGVFSILY